MIQVSRQMLASILKAKQLYHPSKCTCKKNFFNISRQFSGTAQVKLNMCSLKSRSLVELKGRDTTDLLQGLITSDVTLLNDKKLSQYSMMLNVQGRVLYDLLLYYIPSETCDENTLPSTVWIECDSQIKDELIQTIKKYKIRKKVTISDISKDFNIYTSQSLPAVPNTNIRLATVDPRIPELGYRVLVTSDYSTDDSINIEDEVKYRELRYRLGIGEGIVDIPPGNSFPLESNLVFLKGVSFDKGCYIGQELTARTYHTGVTRKRLMPLVFHSDKVDIEAGMNITSEKGKSVGKFRNSVNQYGLGLMRVAEAKGELTVVDKNGQKLVCTTDVPSWWPSENHDL
ncbi:hypothetical protein LOTGIDRAFT_182349 [Lottia gigantea]|uniref:CAF17 C-terminal domain-containing protein n=1 Tax=Lottia gigantea TaxID=225164 RepID=V4AK74_LOTGI|nr:hypothetical protein LOTGIDRAFT_182349 [Lottia gigantea]ESO93946.1 hypothetical protein LOTGIDRAFT_182349 [Lottia gigantea]